MFPGNGGSSLIVVSISVDTISKRTDCPSTVLRKLNLGRSEFVLLILYCSDAIPSMVAFLIGFPKVAFTGNPLFITFINCSYQLGLAGSFVEMMVSDWVMVRVWVRGYG